ncbi:MAG: DUF1192 domain-containing protein [Micavibrio sp.]|nr:DUF1192 domain-containing protein [Micavibrio sp.]
MSFDDDIDPKTKRHKPRLLDNLSVPDLKNYIAQLHEEIIRVEAEVTRKEKHLSAADALFRKKD